MFTAAAEPSQRPRFDVETAPHFFDVDTHLCVSFTFLFRTFMLPTVPY
jgi:hypothetical protein